jgi:tight adherence protein C
MTDTVLLVLGIAALVGALVLAAVIVVGGGRGVEGALVAIESQYGHVVALRPPTAAPELSPLLDRLRSLALRLSPGSFARTLQRRLDVAGNPVRWTPERVLAFKGLGLIGLGLLGTVIGMHGPVTLVLYAGIGAVAGLFLPDLLLYNAGTKRQNNIRKALPDTLDMLTVCVEAGLGFDAALAQVARNTDGPLAAECARVLQEMQFGSSRVDALRALAERTTVAELRVLVSALVQASELGVPVARVLREQSTEMRVRRRQRAEERAQKVPVKVLFPLIFCLFPALFVMVVGPGGINIARTFMR